MSVTAIRPTTDRARRLLTLEARDATISEQLHRLTRERATNREEALRLRMSLTTEERRQYDMGRLR